jgi:DNA-binding IclR family transcriptional regulator
VTEAAEGPKGETSQTLDRGLRILWLLARRENASGLTITEIAHTLGVGRPVVYRLVATLERHQLVTHAPGGRVRVGLGMTALTGSVAPMVQATLAPVLRDLAEAVGATAHLTVEDGHEGVALAVVEPSWPTFHVAYRRGARHPLDRGAAGRAILAARNGTRELVTSEGELQPGAHGIAVPVLLRDGALAASVGVVALEVLDPAVVGPHLTKAARKVVALLE